MSEKKIDFIRLIGFVAGITTALRFQSFVPLGNFAGNWYHYHLDNAHPPKSHSLEKVYLAHHSLTFSDLDIPVSVIGSAFF